MKPLAQLLLWLLLATLLGCDSVDSSNETALFDGQSLDGWIKRGGDANYEVRDGAIVGTAVASTDNTFLCTEKEYRDFELRFDFFPHKNLNSGVQVRSHCFPKPVEYTVGDETINVAAGRVHGYQVELEEEDRDRGWFGGIYDEGRRGWLYPSAADETLQADFGESGDRIWKRGDWNEVRVRCQGDRIQTWINGELRADLRDDMSLRGQIGLQVHAVADEHAGAEVKWRNLRIREFRQDAS